MVLVQKTEMKINEIFYSIQGEGKEAGLPTIFIRTTGCNLRCLFCDTKYAYENGEELATNQIVEKIKKYKCKNICITGGEPLIQKDLMALVDNLLKKDYNILIETNGSISLKQITNKKNLSISCDVKCPSSRMHEKNCFGNIKILDKKDQLKFVISNKKDYDYAKKIIQKHSPRCMVFFQPNWKKDPKKLADWILTDNLDVKLSLQIHKIIWGDVRGR